MEARALRELSGPLHCDDGRSGLFVIDPKNLTEPGAGRLGDRAFTFRLVRRDGDPAAPLLH